MEEHRSLRRGIAAAALAPLAAACLGGGGGLQGSVAISGSSTVEPISALNAEKFAERNPGVGITVDGPGTGDGFELFCGAETDVSDASRPIKDEEIALCARNGVPFVELEIAIDGIAVLTSPGNGFVDCLGFGDLYALLGPESEGVGTWLEAKPVASEVGAVAADGFPEVPLEITAPGEESGTYDSFVELALEDIAEERGHEPVTRKDYVATANDNVIIEGISGSEGSLGWVGFAFFRSNREAVRALEVDGGEGCVMPTEETIAAGDYPVARSLYIYVNADRARTEPAVRRYVDFYLSEEGMTSVGEVGYVRLPPERIGAARDAWREARA